MNNEYLTRFIEPTYTVRIYMSGPIEIAKQTMRKFCMEVGLCVTVEPTTYIYTGGEEQGFIVGLLNYPRFPSQAEQLNQLAEKIARQLLDDTHQHSALLVNPQNTTWISTRTQQENHK